MDQTDEARRQQARYEMDLAQHDLEASRIEEIGHQTFGKQFQEDAIAFAETFGERKQEAVAILRQFDQPAEIIKHLADNPRRLAEMVRMPTARLMTEFSRIESQMAPSGYTETSINPRWKTAPRESGRASDDEWRANGASRLTDDQWNRDFDRRHKEKYGTKPL